MFGGGVERDEHERRKKNCKFLNSHCSSAIVLESIKLKTISKSAMQRKEGNRHKQCRIKDHQRNNFYVKTRARTTINVNLALSFSGLHLDAWAGLYCNLFAFFISRTPIFFMITQNLISTTCTRIANLEMLFDKIIAFRMRFNRQVK